MATHVVTTHLQGFRRVRTDENDILRVLVPLGRVLFAAIFLLAVPSHFSSQTVTYAAAHGVPAANVMVPLSGILALVGGLSVAFGYWTRLGAWLLVLFLVPVTAMMHDFWTVGDVMMARMQQAMFLKNLALIGAALLIAYFGGGPFSLDHRRAKQLGV